MRTLERTSHADPCLDRTHRRQLQERLRNGTELVPLETTPQPHPLAKFVGMFKDDPWIEDWKKSMAEYRRKTDKHPERP